METSGAIKALLLVVQGEITGLEARPTLFLSVQIPRVLKSKPVKITASPQVSPDPDMIQLLQKLNQVSNQDVLREKKHLEHVVDSLSKVRL